MGAMTTKRGPKPHPTDGYRQRLNGYSRGPVVAPHTNKVISFWSELYSLPKGRIIDALLTFAESNADFEIPLTGQRFLQPLKRSRSLRVSLS